MRLIIITLIMLCISANAKVTFKINHEQHMINIVDAENNIDITTSIHNITTQQVATRFGRIFFIHISNTTISKQIKIDENEFNHINSELMK